MELPRPRTQNPIAYHQGTARNQMPKGTGRHKRCHVFRRRMPNRSSVVEFTGIRLVKWLIANDQKEEARKLLAEIKTGRVSAI